ncbi:MAG: response regulator transcription factor [Bacteroidales bacterium]|nr:response regulator transcription factor [Bacteroidales bacterium]MBR2134699.1 response regulator transcription factor [Bacteroidales bacterium]
MTPNEEKKLSLTQKEERILQLISEGKTSKEIADVLCLSLNTIKWYRKKLKAKFDSSSTIQTVRKAIDLGIIN